ncbi:hypothetical protein BJ912DRAFT_693642 [Pholiota molesta]|nr:hypothetical protein BJ912DRAFT_693642 [Pholiota molesta]
MLGRLVGWDTRLSAAVKERTDMQQQRDGETLRARLTESRFAALKEKTGLLISILSINFRLEREPLVKLQTEVRRLQDRNQDLGWTPLRIRESDSQHSQLAWELSVDASRGRWKVIRKTEGQQFISFIRIRLV